MALWDAAAKIAGVPLYRHLSDRLERKNRRSTVNVYAGGGYYYPTDDVARLRDEVYHLTGLGYQHVKIKIGGVPLEQDLRRIEAAARLLPDASHLAVDAIYAYDQTTSIEAASALAPFGLWWFEDICDPLDFETLAAVAERYGGPIAAGEALFSAAEANLLHRHGGLRSDRDILLFDPVHCYGVPGFLQIVELLEARGWPRTAFWPHGGHLFCLHVVAALGLGGAEANPLCFRPFGGYGDEMTVTDGGVELPTVPGIGFELKRSLCETFKDLAA
jgi:L-alanine-DL-glutamate epimerase-like enolase superfamily enzyme